MAIRPLILAGTALAGLVLAATAPLHADEPEILKTEVLDVAEATMVDLGSKRAVGYHGNKNGKCNMTVMVIESGADGAGADASAARVTFAISPGATAKVESVEGRTAEFFCNLGARRLIVTTKSVAANQPRS